MPLLSTATALYVHGMPAIRAFKNGVLVWGSAPPARAQTLPVQLPTKS